MRSHSSTIKYIASFLDDSEVIRLKDEMRRFAPEDTVVRRALAKVDKLTTSPSELLRQLFPFNLSAAGENYWLEIAAKLPSSIHETRDRIKKFTNRAYRTKKETGYQFLMRRVANDVKPQLKLVRDLIYFGIHCDTEYEPWHGEFPRDGNSAAEHLIHMFSWTYTPQGFDYWSKVHAQLVAKEECESLQAQRRIVKTQRAERRRALNKRRSDLLRV